MKSTTSSPIPAFLSVDVEPDGFQLDRRDPPAWGGYVAMGEYLTRLRADLDGWTGRTPRFGWSVRTDPQIAEVHGRPDHALVAFPEGVARLRAAGDYFGVHSHLIRRAPVCGPGGRSSRVPLTPGSLGGRRRGGGRGAGGVLAGPAPIAVEVLYPMARWPSADGYWDIVDQQLRSMPRPYLSLGIRTDAVASDTAATVRRIFDALPGHPLAQRLRFENPLITFRDAL